MKKKVFLLMLLVGIDSLSFGFILPILPFLVGQFWGNSFMAGVIIAASAIGMFLGGSLFGRLSDKFGRKKILIATTSINAFSYLLLGLSSSLTGFLVARFLSGLAGGGSAVSQALISDISTPETRTKNMGMIGASITLGLTLGPVLSMSILSSFSLQQLALLSSFAMAINVVLVYNMIHETRNHTDFLDTTYTPEHLIPQKQDIFNLGPKISLLILNFALVAVVFTGVNTVFGLFMKSAFNYGEHQVIQIFGALGICAISYQLLLLPYVRKQIQENGMILFGLGCISSGLFILAYLAYIKVYPLLALLGGILMIIGICNTNTAIYSLLSSLSNKKECGKILGLNTAFSSIGDIIGPLFAGYIFLQSPVLPFFCFGFGTLISGIVFFIMLKKKIF